MANFSQPDVNIEDARKAAFAAPTLDSAEAHFWGDWGVDGLSDEIWAERKRQIEKRGIQERASGNSHDEYALAEATAKKRYAEHLAAGTLTWLDILREEVYEAFAAPNDANLREELVQVIAVAASWLLDIDRRGTGAPVNALQALADLAEVQAA